MVKAVRSLLRERRGFLAVILGVTALSAALEGVGLSLFIPLLGALVAGGGAVSGESLGVFGAYLRALEGLSAAQQIRWLVVAAVVVLGAKNLLSFAARALTASLEFSAVQTMRLALLRRYLAMDYHVFLERKQGRIVNDIVTETGAAGQALTHVIEIVSRLISAIPLYALLLLISWRATLLATGLFAMIGLGLVPLAAFSRRLGMTRQALARDIWAFTTEIIGGIRQVKVFSAEERMAQRFAGTAGRLRRVNIRLAAAAALAQPAIELAIVAALGLWLLALAAGSLGRPEAALPMTVVFVLVLSRLLPLAASVNTKLVTLRSFAGPVGTVQGLLAAPPVAAADAGPHTNQVSVGAGGRPAAGLRDRIAFEDVWFAYQASGDILRGLSVEFARGETTALVGSSGAGKSTVADLVLRLYEPTRGRVTIDGIDLRELEVASWRRLIGFVSQDTFIFNATIRDNIAFGQPEAGEADICWAAEQADAHELILRLPKGYDTVVGDRGLKLSGGERQRIAIARAVLRRPEILIFDEATSSLDRASEQRVQEAIRRVARDRTVILIAHRLATVLAADRIVILEHGRVAEEGTHDALLAKRGAYWRLAGADGGSAAGGREVREPSASPAVHP